MPFKVISRSTTRTGYYTDHTLQIWNMKSRLSPGPTTFTVYFTFLRVSPIDSATAHTILSLFAHPFPYHFLMSLSYLIWVYRSVVTPHFRRLPFVFPVALFVLSTTRAMRYFSCNLNVSEPRHSGGIPPIILKIFAPELADVLSCFLFSIINQNTFASP